MDRNSARDYINAQPPTFLQAAKIRGYICPRCNQGAHKGVGITKDRTGHYKCFDGSCGLYADVIELFGIANGIQDYKTQLQEAAAYYNITLDTEPSTPGGRTMENQNQSKTERKQQEQPPQDFTLFYKAAAAHISETDYPQRRGLSAEICKRFQIGFIENWKHPNAPSTATGNPRLIIPVSRYSYIARYTGPGDYINYRGEVENKTKVKGRDAVSWTFNRKALQEAQRPIFVVEGEIDALSIIDAGGEAVATGSTVFIDRFLWELKEQPPKQPLIIALDNDTAGRGAAEKLIEGLIQQNLSFYRYNPAGAYKDANERLTADRAGLIEAVARAGSTEQLQQLEAEQRRAEYMQNSAAAHLQEFLNGIAESANTPAIPTGFNNLDAALDGGLYEGLYILGAASSSGKTTVIIQIADQIAQQGHDILYFSLEMARAELMARSISRHTLQEVLTTGGEIRNAKTQRGITAGARYAQYNETEKALIQTAIKQYSRYAEHIFISEGIGNIGVTEIRKTVETHISITGRTPVIVVDYLQILAPYNDRGTDKQNTDKAVIELKRISRDFKTPVIVISSFNRASYKGRAGMEAFKESGAIEYSADVLLALQFAAAGQDGFDEEKEAAKDCREVQLAILKNRSGKRGIAVNYSYYPLFSYFAEN